MRGVKMLASWALVALLPALLGVVTVVPPAEPAEPFPAPLAHSALLTLEGASTPGALILRVRSNAAATPVTVSDFAVTIDGKDAPATARADGAWRVALPANLATSEVRVGVTVTHDGIRELLTAQLPVTAAAPARTAPATGASGLHNQLLWWILNIAIVLIAAVAISRRMS
jgi:hypothetical protein